MNLTYEDLDPSIPASKQVADDLRQEILSGVLIPSSRVPSIRTLATELQIANGTVKAAYKILIDEGFLRANMLGTFVQEHTEISTARRRTVDAQIDMFQQSLLDRGFTLQEVQDSLRRASYKEKR